MSKPIPELRTAVDEAASYDERRDATLALAEALLDDAAEESLSLSRQLLAESELCADEHGTAKALRLMGEAGRRLGSFVDARIQLERSLSLFERLDDSEGVLQATHGIGVLYDRVGFFGDALDNFRTALAIARKLNDRHAIATCTMSVGIAELQLGEYATAMEQIRTARSLYEAIGDRKGLAACTASVGRVHFSKHEDDKALEFFRNSISISEGIGDRHNVMACLFNTGTILLRRSEHSLAREQYELALAIANAVGDRSTAARCKVKIAVVLRLHGKYDDALELIRAASTFFEEVEDRCFLADLSEQKGKIYALVGEYAKAFEQSEKTLAILHGQDDRELKGWRGRLNRSQAGYATLNIGVLLLLFGEHERALEQCRAARAIHEEISEPVGIAHCEFEIGCVYRQMGDSVKALEYSQDALERFRECGDRLGQANCTDNLGIIYFDLGEWDKSLEMHRQSLALYEELGSRSDTARGTLRIGRLCAQELFTGYDPVGAEELLLRCVELATETGAKKIVSDAAQQLAQLYQQQGTWEQAHHYATRHFELKEELNLVEAQRKAQQLEHQKQIAEMEKLRAVEHAEAKAAREVERLKTELIERDLGNTTLQLLAHAELLRDLRTDLLKITRKISPSEPVGRELRDRIKKLPCEAVDWEKYDTQFTAVYPEFIRALTDNAPDLTVTEARICTMLRMNLKSHEIASLFCITEDGVEFHRKNIRKKLKLAKEQKLPLVLAAM